MSDIVGEAVLRIRTDDSDVNRGITSAGKKGGEGYSKGFKDGLKGLAGAAGLAFGADKAVDFLKSGIEAATSFQDETGALNVIIGKEGTAAVQKFGETSAKAFGISKVQALEASHTFATFGKSAGLSGKGLGDFSVKFASLAGDLASFNGGSTEDAITAIGAALRGETEPIRRYGVLLDDMSLRQEAVRQGIIKNIKTALTPQQRVLAAQALIFKQTKDAQGDFARTSDSAANSQKALTAKMADLRLEIGTKLLPVETKVVQALSEFITEMDDGTGAGGKFVEVLKETATVGKAIVDFFDGLPGPVKKYGAELLIAAFAVSKVSNGLTGLVGKLRTVEVGEDGVARASYNVGGALRNLAGAGGLLLVQDGLNRTNRSLSLLETTAGGAAAGFAFAGPAGAILGAAAGYATALYKSTKSAGDIAKHTTPTWQAYGDTLGGVTAHITAMTKARVIDNLSIPKNAKLLSSLGLDQKTLTNATLGRPSAVATVTKKMGEQLHVLDQQIAAQKSYIFDGHHVDSLQLNKLAVLKEQRQALKQQQADQSALLGGVRAEAKAQRQKNALALTYNQLVKLGVPKGVAHFLDNHSVDQDIKQVAELIDKFHIVDKTQWRAILKASGINPTRAELKALQDQLHIIDTTKTEAEVTAKTNQGRAEAKGFLRFISGLTGAVDVVANTKPGKTDANQLVSYINGLTATVDVTATGHHSTSLSDILGGNQTGTEDWRGGFSKVGETGPEIVWMPQHAQVTSAPRTAQLLARTGAGSAPTAQEVGKAVATALVAAGVSGATIINPVPETASASQSRISANTAFLLGG